MATIKAEGIFRLNNLKRLQPAIHLSEHDNEDTFPPMPWPSQRERLIPGFGFQAGIIRGRIVSSL